MGTVKRFEDLDVWKLSRTLCLRVGKIIDNGNLKNNYRLISQLEGSSGSIMDNIAEGFERNSAKDFSHFLVISRGSLSEIKAQLLLAKDLLYLPPQECDKLCAEATEIHKMLNSFKTTLEKKGLVH